MNRTVLIVDDSPILRLAVKRAVMQAGVTPSRIYEAGNGEEALEVIEHESIDLVLLDLNMPVMDGEEFARRALGTPKFSNLTIFVVSTESNNKRLEGMRKLGVQGYLHKPFEPEELRSLVASVWGEAS